MQTIHVLVFAELPGGLDPYEMEQLEILFHRLDPRSLAGDYAAPAWAFVDWSLPYHSGAELCRRLRCNPRTAQAHIVAALNEDKIDLRRSAARAGATEYTQDPLTRDAVIQKILAERLEDMRPLPLQSGNLIIDLAACQVRWHNKPLHLMPTQLRLLQFLVQHPGQIFTRQQLIEALGNFEGRIDERTVDVWVRRVRNALKEVGADNMLRTVRSLGYMLNLPQ